MIEDDFINEYFENKAQQTNTTSTGSYSTVEDKRRVLEEKRKEKLANFGQNSGTLLETSYTDGQGYFKDVMTDDNVTSKRVAFNSSNTVSNSLNINNLTGAYMALGEESLSPSDEEGMSTDGAGNIVSDKETKHLYEFPLLNKDTYGGTNLFKVGTARGDMDVRDRYDASKSPELGYETSNIKSGYLVNAEDNKADIRAKSGSINLIEALINGNSTLANRREFPELKGSSEIFKGSIIGELKANLEEYKDIKGKSDTLWTDEERQLVEEVDYGKQFFNSAKQEARFKGLYANYKNPPKHEDLMVKISKGESFPFFDPKAPDAIENYEEQVDMMQDAMYDRKGMWLDTKVNTAEFTEFTDLRKNALINDLANNALDENGTIKPEFKKAFPAVVARADKFYNIVSNSVGNTIGIVLQSIGNVIQGKDKPFDSAVDKQEAVNLLVTMSDDELVRAVKFLDPSGEELKTLKGFMSEDSEGKDVLTQLEDKGVVEYKLKKVIGATALGMAEQWRQGKNHNKYLEYKDSYSGLSNSAVVATTATTKLFKQLVGYGGTETLETLAETLVTVGDALNTDFIKSAGKSLDETSQELQMDAYLWNNIEQQGDAEKWGHNTLEVQRRSQRDHKVFEEWGGGILGAVGVATEYVKTGDVLNAVIESIPYLVAGKTKIGTIGLATSYTTAGVANAEIQDLQHRKDDFGATGGLSNTDYNTIAATGMLYATLNRGATSLMTRTGGGTIVGASEDFVSKNVISHLYKVPWLGGVMATTASVGVKSGLVAGGGEGLEELIQSSVFDPILNDYYTIKQKLTNGSYLEYYRETLLDQGLIAAGVGGATGSSIHFGLNSYSNMRNGILPGTDRVALYEHKLGEADKAIDEELSILARSMVTDKDRDQTITHLDNTLERLTQGKKDLEEMQNLRDKVVETDEYKNLLEAFNNKTKAETELAKVELKKAELEGSTTLDEDFTEINLEIGSKQEVYDNYQSILENFDRVDKPTSLDIDGQPSSLKDLLYKFDMAGTSVASIERMNTIFNNKKEIEDKLGKDLTKELDIAINNYLGKNASKIRDEDIVTLEAVTALLLTAANKKQDSKEVDHSNDITLKNDKGEKTGIVVNEDNSILVNGVTHYVVETENGIVTVRARDTNKDISEKGNAVNSTEEIGNIETAKTEYQNRTDRKAKETILNITKNLKDTNKNLEEVMVETALGMKDVLSKDEIDSISNQLGSRKRTTMNQKIAFSIGMINGLDRTQNNNQVQKLDDVIRLTSDYKTKIENSKRTVHQGQTTNTNVVKETAEDLAGLMKNVDWTQFYKTRLKRRSATKVREELDKWDNGALALMKQTNSSSESPVKLLNRLIDIVIKDRDKTDNLLTTSRDDYVFNIERIVSEKYHKTLGINPVTASYEMGRNAWSPITTVEEDVVDIPKPDELEEAAKVIVSSGTKTNAVVEEFNKKTKDMNLDSSKGLQDYVLNLTGQAIQSLISKGMLTEDYNANKMVDYVVAAIKSGRVNRNNSEGIKQLINDKVYELSGEDKTMSAKITNTTRLADLKTAVQNKVATDKTDTKSLVKLALISTIESMYGTRDFTIQDIVDEMLKMDMTEKSKTEEERTVYMQNAVEVIDELFNDEGSSAQAGIIINAVFSASDTIGKDSATEVNKAFNSEVINKSSVKLLSKQMFGDSLKVKLYKGLNDKQKKNKSKSGTTIKPKNEKKGKQASVIRTFSNIINYFNTGNTEHIYEEGSTVSDSLKQANSETFMPENISEMYNKALEKLPNLDALVSSREQGSQSAVFNSNDSTQEYEGKVKILLTLGINEVLDNMSSNMDIESKNTSPENYTSTVAAKKYEVVNQIGKKYMDLFGLNVYNSKDKAEIIAWRNKIGEEAIVLLKQLGMVDIQKDVEFTVDPNSLVKDDGKSVYRNKSSVSITDIKAFKETGKKSTSKNTKIDSQTGIVLTSNLVDNTLIHKVGNTEPVNFFNLDGYEKTEKDTIVSMLFQRFSGIKDPLRPLNPGNKHTPSANKVETPRVQKDGAKIAKEHQEFIDKMQENPLKLSNTAKKILLPLVKAYAESVGDAKGGYVTVMKFLRQNGKGKNIARMLGITSAEVGLVDDNLASNLGKELGKGNHLVNILRFITENSEDGNYEEFMKRDLYFSHDVGRNMRGHLNEQTLNYQADKKYSRNLLTGGEYTTSNMTEYLILIESISDKTGLSSDQILNDSGNDVLEILLTDDNIDSAIADIVDNIVESEEGVSEANRELLQSLDLKGSGLMGSAVAIKAIKDIRTAYKSDNKFSVTTEYMAEVDATSSGFTNISLNLLGYKHNKATTKHYLEQGDQNLLEGGVIDGYKVLTKLLEGLRSKLVNNTEAEGTKKELSTAEKMLAMAGKNLDKESTVGDNLKIGAKIMFDVLGMSPRDAAKMPSMVRGYHASIQAISRNIQIDMRSGLLEAYASGNTKAIEVLNEVLGRGTEIDINNLDLNDYKAISEAIAPLADRIAKEAQNSLKDQTDISDKFIGGSYDLLADIIHKGLIPNYKTIKMNSIFEVMKGVTPNRANAEVLMKQKHVLLENGGQDTNGNILVDLKDMPNSPTSKVIPFHMIDSYLLAQSYSEAYTEVYGSTDQDTTNKIRYGVMTVHDAVYGNTEMLAAFNKHYNGNTIKVAKEYDVVEQMLNEVKYVVDTYEGELKTTPRGKTHLKKMKDHIVKMEKVIATAKAEKEEILKSVDSVQVMGATKPNVKKDILNGIIKNDKELGKLKDSMNSVLTDLKSNEDGILSKEQIKKVNKINEYLKEC